MSHQQQFEIFRTNFPLARVIVYDDYMVYKVKSGYAEPAARDANKLIEQMGLDLTAIPTKLHSQDSFCVQSNETEV